MVLSAFSSEVKRSVTIISSYHGAEVQTLTKKMGKEKQNVVCVFTHTYEREEREIYYNCYRGQIDKKDDLLQIYLVERERMNKKYMKLFIRLHNTTAINPLIVCRKSVGRKVSSFERLLVKCSCNI
jgi:hypothetical protein